MIKVKLKDSEATKLFGKTLSKYLAKYDVICLDGDLGAGKTTLSQGILTGLGVVGEVSSPTFTLIEAYEYLRVPVYHIDVYRLIENPDEIFDLGLEEYLSEPTIVLIEWASLIQNKLPKNCIYITINRTEDNMRMLSLVSNFEDELLKEWDDENFSH